jgi:hypothetical protein
MKVQPKPKMGVLPPPTDCSGKFPDGRTFADLTEFSGLLRDEQSKSRYQFGEVLIRQLAGYALNRSLNVTDDAIVGHWVESARKEEWRLRDVIKIIVLSKAFTHG